MLLVVLLFFLFFFFNDTATTEIYTLSLHDALPISTARSSWRRARFCTCKTFPSTWRCRRRARGSRRRSEEHTSELQSLAYLVCRLLLEKKKNKIKKQLSTSDRPRWNNSAYARRTPR